MIATFAAVGFQEAVAPWVLRSKNMCDVARPVEDIALHCIARDLSRGRLPVGKGIVIAPLRAKIHHGQAVAIGKENVVRLGIVATGVVEHSAMQSGANDVTDDVNAGRRSVKVHPPNNVAAIGASFAVDADCLVAVRAGTDSVGDVVEAYGVVYKPRRWVSASHIVGVAGTEHFCMHRGSLVLDAGGWAWKDDALIVLEGGKHGALRIRGKVVS